MFADYYIAMMEQMMPPYFMRGMGLEETVTIRLDRYERLKSDLAEAVEQKSAAAKEATEYGKLLMYCEAVKFQTQIAIDPLQLLPDLFEVHVQIYSNAHRFSVFVTDKHSNQQLLVQAYDVENSRVRIAGEKNWEFSYLGIGGLVSDFVTKYKAARDKLNAGREASQARKAARKSSAKKHSKRNVH